MKFPRKICGIPVPAAVVILLILSYVFVFGRATLFVWQVKKGVAHDPLVARVPTPLPDTSISPIAGTTVSYFGYQFEVPWQGTVAERYPGSDGIAVLYMPSGQEAVSFFNPAKNPGLVKRGRAELKARGQNPDAANLYLDAQSDYDLERSILFAIPNKLSFVFPRRKAVFAATRLMIKHDTEERGMKTGLYSFRMGLLHGFQFGDPALTRSIHVDAYDDQDQKFEFIFGGNPGIEFVLKQQELNRVLQSLKPVPPAPE